MEHLDSKYFERVIAALRQARDSQTIEINENFKRTLRARIEERAMMPLETAEPNWVEWVLRSRYVPGGVPVMAALVLVTMAALNHNVPMDSQMLAETGEVNEGRVLDAQADLLLSQPAVTMTRSQQDSAFSPDVNAEHRLETFSAELVMPPAEVMAAREAYLRALESGPDQLEMTQMPYTVKTVSSSPAYTFFEGAINSILNIPVPQTEEPVSAVRVEKTIPQTVSTDPVPANATVTTPVPAESHGQIVPTTVVEVIPMKGEIEVSKEQTKPSMPSEASGKLVEPEPQADTVMTPTQTAATQPLSSPATVSTPAPLSTPVLPEAYMVVDPAKGTFEKISVAPVPPAETMSPAVVEPALEEVSLEEVSLEAVSPINTFDLRSEPLAPLLESVEVDNQPLLAERIYFRGELREKLVRAVMLALAGRDGNLSRDYYVNIAASPDGTYRATLYEHAKSRTLLVIAAQRTGEYRVITQVNY